MSTAEAEGDFDSTDVRPPRLNVVAKVGDLSNQFDPGSIVLSKELLLVLKDQALNVVPVKIRKRFQEDTEFGEEMGETASTLQEVLSKGGQIKDRNADNFWTKLLDIVFLVEKPATADEKLKLALDLAFNIVIADKSYTFAAYTARKSSYTSVAVPIITAMQQGRGVQDIMYTMTSALSKFNGNTWFKPTLRPAGKTTAEIAAYLSGVNV